jgi:hypothetical protein
MPPIHEEIDELWKQVAEEAAMQLPELTAMSEFLDEVAEEVASVGRPKLEPWVSILEVGILWLAHLHISLDREMERHSGDRILVPWSLTGFAVSQAVAIHRLSLSGLDSAAKGSLRSLIEAINALIVCLADEELSTRFREPQSFEEARRLWYLELSPKRLSVRLSNIIKSFGLDDQAEAALQDWMRQELELAPQFVHVSYLAAVFTCKSPHVDNQMMRPAIFGSPSVFSVRTLAQAAKTIWFFSRIGFALLVRPQAVDSEPIHRLDVNEENDRTVALGYYVYSELVFDHWEDDNTPPPEEPGVTGRGDR